MEQSYVYIMSNKPHGVIYIGVTSNLVKRVYEHKNSVTQGFTEKYKLHKLVFFEIFDDIENAINREKQLKNWHRQWKINLIESKNKNWNDLYQTIIN